MLGLCEELLHRIFMKILVDDATLFEEKHISCMDLDIVYIVYELMLSMLFPIQFSSCYARNIHC